MKQLYFFPCILTLLFSVDRLNAQCNPAGRYYNQVFSDSVTTVQYGNAIEYNGVDTNLLVDIYQPSGDNFARRPLMVFAFGGSFTSGLRESPDLVILCTYFSQRGYVCASIDYRLGIQQSNDSEEFAALLRGVQDMKAAVRFFYKDAQTTNTYRIDTNQIFIGGVSAGAFIALNYGYMKTDTFSFIPPSFAEQVVVELGGLDGNSGNPGYSEKVKGVIDLSGGIADTVWIMPGDPILVGEHGTDDSLVTCWYDSVYALTHETSRLFGGGDIKNRLSHIDLIDSFYLFWGAGHCPFILPKDSSIQAILAVPNYMDTTEWLIRDFLYQNVICDSAGATGIYQQPVSNLAVTIYPNPSDDAVGIYSADPRDLYLKVINSVGQVVQTGVLPGNSSLILNRGDLDAGVYLVAFFDKYTGALLKMEKIVFD